VVPERYHPSFDSTQQEVVVTPFHLLPFVIAAATGLVGLIFLLFPQRIGPLEDILNAHWGNRELTALRLGLRGEQALERVLNRPVLDRNITWDGWARRHPRRVGAVLCLLAAGLCWLG
jgi:hypothetical protein